MQADAPALSLSLNVPERTNDETRLSIIVQVGAQTVAGRRARGISEGNWDKLTF